MAKGRKALAAEMKKRDEDADKRYQESVVAAKTPSPAETDQETDRSAYMAYKKAGDFTKLPPGLIGLSYGPSAERRRDLERSSVPTGIFGMGGAYANPTALGLAQQNMADTNAQADAENYQSQIGAEDMYQRTGNSQSLMAQDFARKMGLLGNTGSMSQFNTQNRISTTPQSILPMLLSGLMSGASSYFAGGFAKGGGGGGGGASP